MSKEATEKRERFFRENPVVFELYQAVKNTNNSSGGGV